jgi:hypothetical protein
MGGVRASKPSEASTTHDHRMREKMLDRSSGEGQSKTRLSLRISKPKSKYNDTATRLSEATKGCRSCTSQLPLISLTNSTHTRICDRTQRNTYTHSPRRENHGFAERQFLLGVTRVLHCFLARRPHIFHSFARLI